MNQIAVTIIPIFAIVCLGLLAGWRGFLPAAFFEPANRLVFYIAIPAMIFRSISGVSLHAQFNPRVLWICLASILTVFIVCWCLSVLFKVSWKSKATFIQGSMHGNLGYIGLAVAFYYLGDDGLAKAGILAGFIMILQNLLAVIVLQTHSENASSRIDPVRILWKVMGNPVVLSALGGILFSAAGYTLPLVIDRSLSILSGLALPTALLIIGATLSLSRVMKRIVHVIFICVFKLLVLPAVGFVLFLLFGIAVKDFLPALILLSSPTATISFVMAKEMKADSDLAVAAISATTLLSAFTISLWLRLAG